MNNNSKEWNPETKSYEPLPEAPKPVRKPYWKTCPKHGRYEVDPRYSARCSACHWES